MVVDDVDFLSRAQDMRNGLALEVGLAVRRRHCGDLRRALFDLGKTENELGGLMSAIEALNLAMCASSFLTPLNRSGELAPAGFR